MRPWKPLLATWLAASAAGCTCNLLLDPQERAASVPATADVAVGATHDLLVVACQDKVTLLDFVLPTATTALFVSLGRLDAAFYLPGAVAKAAIPQCEPVPYTVRGAAMEGGSFELEPTANPNAFKAHARAEGESIFHADVAAGDEQIAVASTFRAWNADRVQFSPRCVRGAADAGVLPGWIPAGGSTEFDHRLYRGDTPLAGYGYAGVGHPRLTVTAYNRGSLTVQIAPERGPFTVTSEVDPGFSLALTAYDATDLDPPTLVRATSERFFVGETTALFVPATIGGQVPCASGSFLRDLVLQTPSVCRFKNSPTATTVPASGSGPVTLEAVQQGTCRLVAVDRATGANASLEIPVHRAFETMAAFPTEAVRANVHLNDLWLAGPDEVHLVGWESALNGRDQGLTLRYAGGAWGPLQKSAWPRNLRAVHGSRVDGTAVAVGPRGEATVWNGTTWTPSDAGTRADGGTLENFEDVWVASATEAWAVGEQGTFMHFGGSQWTGLDAGTAARLRSVWGDGAGHVYLVGWFGTALSWDGYTYSDVLPPQAQDAGFHANFVTGSGPADLWISNNQDALHWNGSAWAQSRFASAAGDAVLGLYAVGDGHAYVLVRRSMSYFVDRYDGTRAVSIPLPASARAISGVGNDVVVLTSTQLLRYRHDPADVFP